MNLTALTESDKLRYYQYLSNQPFSPFLQAWEWGQWQAQLGRKPERFFIEHQGKIVLSAQILLTQVPLLKAKYIYIPHGPLLAGSVTETESEQILNLFFSELEKRFPKCLFIRAEPLQNFSEYFQREKAKKTKNIQSGKTILISLNQSPEALLGNMHPKTRYNIKIAKKHNVQIQTHIVASPKFGLYLKEAVDLIVITAKRQNYKAHPEIYYKNLVDFFTAHAGNLDVSIYKALLGSKILASAIMVDFCNVRTYVFGGSSEENRKAMAPYLLHWQAMQDAKNKGLEIYDLGGSETAGGKEKGFSRFKTGFGGRMVTYPGAYDLVKNKLWYNAYTLFRYVNNLIR